MCILYIAIEGIEEALALLDRGGGTVGGTIIVVSDGEENRAPYIEDVWDAVRTEKQYSALPL